MDSIKITKLKWIQNLRWIAIFSQIALIPFAVKFGYLSKENISTYLLVSTLLIFINFRFFSNRLSSIYNNISLQLIVDIVAFTIIILLTGKMENPFWPLIYLHGGMSAFLIEPKKDYHFLPFLFGSMVIVHILSIQIYSSITFILIPQWIILIAIWFLTRGIATILLRQHSLILKLSQKELKYQKLKSIGLLSSGILHELGTPLNTIRLKINRLKNKGVDSFSAHDIDVMDKSLFSIEDVLNKLNKAQYESETMMSQTVELISWMTNYFKLLKIEFRELNISSNTDISPCYVKIAKMNFSLILKVLLNNSLEAGATEVQIDFKIHNNQVSIFIQDNGPGFDQFVFDNFMAPYTSTKGKGRGIGLFNAGLSLESMGGKLSLENSEAGALVCIQLECSHEN